MNASEVGSFESWYIDNLYSCIGLILLPVFFSVVQKDHILILNPT